MATETSGVAVTTPTDVGLKRELGLIGSTWASETSIIGSGWLFGALYAAQAVGGAAVLAWAIAGVIVIVLALCHAELGAMYPVSGGTARFPHFAFGSVAGISFGFFSYVQAVTIAPIECFAFMQYASHFWPSIYNPTTKNVTTYRLHTDHHPDGGLRSGQLPGHAHLRPGQQRHHVVEGRGPGPGHHRAAVQVPPRQLHRRRGLHAGRDQGAVRRAPGRGHHLRLLRVRAVRPASRGDQEPGPQPAAGDHHIDPDRHRDLRPAPGRVHRRDAPGPAGQGVRGDHQHERPVRAVRRPGGPDRARLAGVHPADRRVRLAVRHRPDLHDRDVAGQLRPGQKPVLPADLRQGRQERHPVGRADLRVPDRTAVPAAVPQLALAGRPDHRRERADVRRGPAVRGRVPRPGPRRQPAVPDAAPSSSPRSRSPSPTCSSTGRASR